MQTYLCAGCRHELPHSSFHEFKNTKRRRPVTSRCKACRKEAYYTSRYPEVCVSCQLHRPVDQGGVCRRCNEQLGLRQCRRCLLTLPSFAAFFGRQATCKGCVKEAAEPGAGRARSTTS